MFPIFPFPAAWDGTAYEKNRKSVAIKDVAAAQKDQKNIAGDGGAGGVGGDGGGVGGDDGAGGGGSRSGAAVTAAAGLPDACLHTDGTVRDKQIMVGTSTKANNAPTRSPTIIFGRRVSRNQNSASSRRSSI